MPAGALDTYETLRGAALAGQGRPAGLAALRFHGMLHGLGVLARSPGQASPETVAPPPRCVAVDDQFVRLLANLVLRTHSELMHVY